MSDIFSLAMQLRASDIHVGVGMPPLARIDGLLKPLPGLPLLSATDVQRLLYSLISTAQRERFEVDWEFDFSLEVNRQRFRGNFFWQYNGPKGIFRAISKTIPTPEELQIPLSMLQLTDLPRGLVLVTGATGSGKSTTLACLIDRVNQKRNGHILTIEDPVEYIHDNKSCEISQREVGHQTHSFASALKYALRQDPNVVLIGELRDLETISAALTVAETGHLVFATLHTTDITQTVDRMIDVFPSHQQQQVRSQLSSVLKAVIGQTLLPLASGTGRVAAREIMIVNSPIAALIREGKTHQIYGVVDTHLQQGMISLERALTELVRHGLVTPKEAMSRANRPEMLANNLRTLSASPPPQ